LSSSCSSSSSSSSSSSGFILGKIRKVHLLQLGASVLHHLQHQHLQMTSLSAKYLGSVISDPDMMVKDSKRFLESALRDEESDDEPDDDDASFQGSATKRHRLSQCVVTNSSSSSFLSNTNSTTYTALLSMIARTRPLLEPEQKFIEEKMAEITTSETFLQVQVSELLSIKTGESNFTKGVISTKKIKKNQVLSCMTGTIVCATEFHQHKS
jgi:hypothetical protein